MADEERPVEEPVEEPAAEQPAAEEPAAEEPAADEPEAAPSPKEDAAVDVAPNGDDAPKEEAPKEEAPKEDAAKEPKGDEAKEEVVAEEEAVADEEKKEEPEDAKPPAEYQLYYWQGFGGRGGVIRLALALCDAEWDEGFQGMDRAQMDEIGGTVKGSDIDNFPNFAYPVLRHNKKIGATETEPVVISQTVAIVQYILSVHGRCPEDKVDEMHALSTALTALDAWNEWMFKKNKWIGFEGWITNRIGSFLAVFNAALKRNDGGKGWFFGDSPCIADLFVVDLLRRYKKEKPLHFQNNPFTELRALVERFEKLPQIKKYIESERYQPFQEGKGFASL